MLRSEDEEPFRAHRCACRTSTIEMYCDLWDPPMFLHRYKYMLGKHIYWSKMKSERTGSWSEIGARVFDWENVSIDGMVCSHQLLSIWNSRTHIPEDRSVLRAKEDNLQANFTGVLSCVGGGVGGLWLSAAFSCKCLLPQLWTF